MAAPEAGWVGKVGGGECPRSARWRGRSGRSARANQRPDQSGGGSFVGVRRSAKRQAQHTGVASTRRAEARQARRQRPEWHRAVPHRPPGCCEHPPLAAPARGPQCGEGAPLRVLLLLLLLLLLLSGRRRGRGWPSSLARRRGQRGGDVRRHRRPHTTHSHAARGASADTRRGRGDRTAPHRRPSGVAPHSVVSAI